MREQPATIQGAIIGEDQMIYFVQVDYGFRLGRAWVERDPGRMDRASTVEDITRGEWSAEVVKVIECNPVENICNDITNDILAECLGLRLQAAE